MNRFFIAMYDSEDYPYMTFENYKEAAKFLHTTSDVIACNIYRCQKKRYKGKEYTLHKIKLDDSDITIKKNSKNLHIGALLEVLNI